jgi:peptidoglycan hydrolase-like protein with peptidoglycan-binding domain
MNRKRILTLFLVLALVTVAAAGSWIAGSTIKSPAEVAARTAPPSPSPILVPVESRVLSSEVVTRGTARFVLPRSISIVPSALKRRAGVIATLPERGRQLDEGDVLLTASGRPVFVLESDIPCYRDLVPGLEGEDVRRFEGALKRLGFDPGPVDGTFDERTSAAVAAWYAAAGWDPFGPTPEQLASVRALEHELADETRRRLAARARAAPLAVEAARANAESADKIAAAEVAAKGSLRERVAADPKATDREREVAAAELEVAEAAALATRLAGRMAVQAAIDAKEAAEREMELAEEAIARLTADLSNERRRTGVQVPADEIVFVPELPVRVEKVEVAVGDAAEGTVMKVTSNQLAIDSSLRLDEAPLVKAGMRVAIDEPALGIRAKGVVRRVAEAPGTDGVDGYHVYFETLVEEASTAIEGFSLRLTIPIQSTEGTVTAVPVSALSLTADGTSRLQVEKNGAIEFLSVEPGLSADGFVAVKPVGGTLEAGELVVVGYETNGD